MTCGHDYALPVGSSTSEPTRALTDDDVKWHHHHLLTDLALREVCVTIHCRMGGHVCNGMAEICVYTVSRPSTYNLSWIKILNRQLGFVMLLSVFGHITLHKQGQVDAVYTIGTVIKVAWRLRIALKNLGLIFVNQATIGTLRNYNDDMTFYFSALND